MYHWIPSILHDSSRIFQLLPEEGHFRFPQFAPISSRRTPGLPINSRLSFPVEQEETHCLDQGPMWLKCHLGYTIKIRSATIQRTKVSGCAPGSDDTCVVSTVTSDVWNTCNFRPSCVYTAQEPASNPCASSMGSPYLAVTYFCEPRE